MRNISALAALLLALCASAHAASLTATDTSEIETGFLIQQFTDGAFREIGRLPPNPGTGRIRFLLEKIEPGACYRIFAYNMVGLSDPSPVACVPQKAPSRPEAAAVEE